MATPLRNCWSCANRIDRDYPHLPPGCEALLKAVRAEGASASTGAIAGWISFTHRDDQMRLTRMPPKDADGCPAWAPGDAPS